jgi:hypothetical protein
LLQVQGAGRTGNESRPFDHREIFQKLDHVV